MATGSILRAFILSLLLIFISAPVSSEILIYKGSNNFKMNLFGHINRALWVASDGHKTSAQFVDNNSSSSRAALQAERDLGKHLKGGGIYMFEIEQNSSRFTTITHPENKKVSYDTRKAEVYLVSQSLGELYGVHGYM